MYHSYYSSGDIARANDLDKILTEPDTEWGYTCNLLWKYECQKSHGQAGILMDEAMVEIYSETIQSLIDNIQSVEEVKQG